MAAGMVHPILAGSVYLCIWCYLLRGALIVLRRICSMAKQSGRRDVVDQPANNVAISVKNVSKSFKPPHNRQNSIKGSLVNLLMAVIARRNTAGTAQRFIWG